MSDSTSSSSSKKGFWDILLIQDDGKWFAFRSPWKNLQNLASYLSILLVFAVISTVGWFFSRWRVEQLEDKLVSAKLEIRSLESKNAAPVVSGTSGEKPGELSGALYLQFPLTQQVYNNPSVSSHDLKAQYDSAKQEIKLEVGVGLATLNENQKVYWAMILSGVNGLYAFPDVLTLKGKEPFDYKKFKEIDSKDKAKISVSEKVAIPGFIRKISEEPYMVYSLLYDQHGKLISKNVNPLLYGAE